MKTKIRLTIVGLLLFNIIFVNARNIMAEETVALNSHSNIAITNDKNTNDVSRSTVELTEAEVEAAKNHKLFLCFNPESQSWQLKYAVPVNMERTEILADEYVVIEEDETWNLVSDYYYLTRDVFGTDNVMALDQLLSVAKRSDSDEDFAIVEKDGRILLVYNKHANTKDHPEYIYVDGTDVEASLKKKFIETDGATGQLSHLIDGSVEQILIVYEDDSYEWIPDTEIAGFVTEEELRETNAIYVSDNGEIVSGLVDFSDKLPVMPEYYPLSMEIDASGNIYLQESTNTLTPSSALPPTSTVTPLPTQIVTQKSDEDKVVIQQEYVAEKSNDKTDKEGFYKKILLVVVVILCILFFGVLYVFMVYLMAKKLSESKPKNTKEKTDK